MDIRFKVLIVDDSILNTDDSTYQIIEKKIKTIGFTPDIKLSNGLDYKDKITSDDYDLYLVDYNLVDKIHGQDVIIDVRDNNRSLTDIIFYSSATSTEDLYQELSKNNIDGVYVCPREYLSLKTERILEKLEKRTLNPLYLRGMVLHNYSDIEIRLREFLLTKYKSQSSELKTKISDKILEIICESEDDYGKKIVDCKNSKDFVESLFLHENYLFDMGKKLKLLAFLKKQNIINLSNSNISSLVKLNKERNKLGHSKIFMKDGEMVTQDINKVVDKYTSKKCRDIRKDIKKAQDILDHLEQQN